MKVFLQMLALLLPFYTLPAQTTRIKFTAPLLYPEGTAYYTAGNCFFVSSVTTGTIGKVNLNGDYSVFYEEPGLKSSYGMKVDTRHNKLWVCTGDANYSKYSEPSTYKKLIRVISLSLTTGQKIDDINLSGLLPGEHFANDLTLDATGNIYVTDSYAGAIYKINLQLQPSVFSKCDLFKSIDVGLNGIIWHPHGYLIAAHSSNGALYKIRTATPGVVEKIETKTFFSGIDGLYFNDGDLVVVQNKGSNKISKLRTLSDWNSAKVVAGTLLVDRFDNPTTLAKKGDTYYALNAKLNELTDPVEVPSKEFSLQLVRFIPIF